MRRQRRRYPQVYDGEWVAPRRSEYRMACCDCGLVHVLQFRLVPYGSGRAIEFRGFRDARATAGIRRGMKGSAV